MIDVQPNSTIEDSQEEYKNIQCGYCNSSDIVKNGNRKNSNNIKQRYRCKNCGRSFILEKEFSGLKGNSKVVTLVLDLYFKGMSLRKIEDHLKQFYDIDVKYVTIYRWIRRFIRIMNDYVDTFKPEVGDVWQTDEMSIKSKGENVWLWNCLDKDTRFLLSNIVTSSRYVKDARLVFHKARQISETKPTAIITDGLPAYYEAIQREFNWTPDKRKVEHVKLVAIRDHINNNRVERFHGSTRERTKVLRGFKGNLQAQAILNGFRTYYNFIRPHYALDGKTPAQVSGIDLQLDGNRWLNLIQKSVHQPNCNKA